MSTRSNISLELPNGRYKTVYCHFDGYLEHNGAILLEHYNTREKVEKLLSYGNISALAPKVEPEKGMPHSFEYSERQKDVCTFYGRDRGDEKQEAKDLTLHDLKQADWIDFFYIFTLNNEWKYYDYNFERLKDVKEDLAEILQKEDPTNGKWVKASDDLVKACKKKKHNSDEEM